MSQQRAAAYLRHGQTPFFRLPTAGFHEAGASAYSGADAVLLGVPWDGSVTYRPGARFAPYELRRVARSCSRITPATASTCSVRSTCSTGAMCPFPRFTPTPCAS